MSNDDHCEFFAEYTPLGRYQRAHRQIYAAQRLATGTRLIVVSLDQTHRHCSSCVAALPYDEACALMRYLYENRVSAECWLDILADCGIATEQITKQSARRSAKQSTGQIKTDA